LKVKRKLITFLLVAVMALSFAVPARASEATMFEPTPIVTEQEVTPFTEMTQIYWRYTQGQLYMRVWSITNGRWLTYWIPL